MVTSIPASSASALGSQITSLSSVYQSAASVLETATAKVAVISLQKEMLKLSASLLVKSEELVLATLTASTAIAQLSTNLIQLEDQLQTLINENSIYGGMVPNLAFNLVMCIVFGLLICFNVYGLFYKQWWFSIAFICATVLELLGYIGRVISHSHLDAINPFLLQFICLTIAPVFTMGGVYYQLLKLSKIYGDHYSRWAPIIYSYIFITCDVVSLVIQAIGGGMAGVLVQKYEDTANGTHVFVAGLALQVLSMSLFLVLWFDFLYSIYIRAGRDAKQSGEKIDDLYNPEYRGLRSTKLFKWFNLLLTFAVILIYIRCIYRVCELAEGWRGNLITHEKYFIALDAVMISLACVIFVPFFPGFVFDGKNSHIPIAKTKKTFNKNQKRTSFFGNNNNNDEEYEFKDDTLQQ